MMGPDVHLSASSCSRSHDVISVCGSLVPIPLPTFLTKILQGLSFWGVFLFRVISSLKRQELGQELAKQAEVLQSETGRKMLTRGLDPRWLLPSRTASRPWEDIPGPKFPGGPEFREVHPLGLRRLPEAAPENVGSCPGQHLARGKHVGREAALAQRRARWLSTGERAVRKSVVRRARVRFESGAGFLRATCETLLSAHEIQFYSNHLKTTQFSSIPLNFTQNILRR